jgi:phosphoribosylformylglycinamidine synthase
VDFGREQALAGFMARAAELGLVRCAHDLSEGGLAQALAESCLRKGIGASVAVGEEAFVALFSESASRVLVAVPIGLRQAFEALVAESEIPLTGLGATGGTALVVKDQFEVPLDELRAAWSSTLPKLFG